MGKINKPIFGFVSLAVVIFGTFCNPKYDDAARIGFQNLLRIFDKVIVIGLA